MIHSFFLHLTAFFKQTCIFNQVISEVRAEAEILVERKVFWRTQTEFFQPYMQAMHMFLSSSSRRVLRLNTPLMEFLLTAWEAGFG